MFITSHIIKLAFPHFFSFLNTEYTSTMMTFYMLRSICVKCSCIFCLNDVIYRIKRYDFEDFYIHIPLWDWPLQFHFSDTSYTYPKFDCRMLLDFIWKQQCMSHFFYSISTADENNTLFYTMPNVTLHCIVLRNKVFYLFYIWELLYNCFRLLTFSGRTFHNT